jgi:nucleotide-binding universal stress UspA family protein
MSARAQVLIAVDFSPSSDEAVRSVAQLARPSGGEVVLLHVDALPATAPLSADAVARRDRLRSALEALRQGLVDCEVEAVALLRPGEPGREILRVAESCSPQMIVVGAHGQSSATTPLLGSVADRVVRYSPFPVLVVPHVSRRPRPVTDFAAG